jgi:uncharacterized protein with GYD domain
MPTYVILYRFTEQGRKKIKDTVRRAQRIRQENERRGFRVVGTWWTQGQYDLVAVLEAPSEQAMLQGLFNIAEAGNVSSETLRAYTDQEMARALTGPRAAAAAGSTKRRAASPRRATGARRTTTRRRTAARRG